tara:strand:+ start:548 stop:823 length:276 start_codon:yes stop_codon:yes gene_type:complete
MSLSGGKRPLNEFMKAKEKARKEGKESFTYKSKNGVMKYYKFKKTKTGMLVPAETDKNGKFINKSEAKAKAKAKKKAAREKKKQKKMTQSK